MDIRRIILMIFTFGLGAVLLYFIFMDAAGDRARDEARQAAEIEARQYEIQIQNLEVEILEREKKAAVTSDHGRAVMGFYLSGPEDVADVVSLGEQYGFRPTVLLDCGKSEEELLSITEAMQAAGFPADIMLTGSPFDGDVNARARMLLSELPAGGFSRGISFLLRNADDSEENRALILDEAYSGYSFYSDNTVSGTLPSGTPYIAYSFMSKEDLNIGSTLRKLRSAKTCMILVTDLEAVAGGTVNRETAHGWIEETFEEQGKDGLEICSLDDAFGELRRLRAENDAAMEAYEAFKAEKESEIAELREKIRDIKK